MSWGAAGGFFEEAGVALEEEDVEEEVEVQGAEVEKRCYYPPVLDTQLAVSDLYGIVGFGRRGVGTVPAI